MGVYVLDFLFILGHRGTVGNTNVSVPILKPWASPSKELGRRGEGGVLSEAQGRVGAGKRAQ